MAAPSRLDRFLRPRTVAVVGASERQPRSNNAVGAMREAGVDLVLVNPNRPEVYDQPAFADLASIGRPIDAVLSLVGAEAAIEIVADAAAAGAGGVVVIAGGFGESGGDGVDLERRLGEAAGAMPLLGPNCNGFIRPAIGARLSGAPRLPFPGGRIGVVTHSGALLGAFGLAAEERGVGYSTVISTGNELAVDMAESVEFLVDDEETVVIALVVETIRDPQRFFAATDRAAAAGKPVVALKLGRSERGSEIAASHTGALTGEAWVYDAAFRQHGIVPASDLVDLLDRVSLLAQLPRSKWRAVDGLGVMSLSGGWSAMASDVCAEEGVPVPSLTALRDQVNLLVPERTTVNPLDMTGFAMGRQDVVRGLIDTFASSAEVDVVMVQWFVDETAGEPGAAIIEALVEAAPEVEAPLVMGSIEDGHLGEWARALPERGVAVGRGLRSTIRGLATMSTVVRFSRRGLAQPATEASALPRPEEIVDSSVGPMLSFAVAMRLLSEAGIPVAAYSVVAPDQDLDSVDVGFDGPYVVKLADVPHRTELGAVRVGIAAAELAAAIADLRQIADRHHVPALVAIQEQAEVVGEALLGIQGESGLGPMVVCGLGGIMVEVLGRVTGRLAPLAERDAAELAEELAEAGVFEGHRGGQGWDRKQLEELLVKAGSLADGGREWIASLDVNPLAMTPRGFVALDCLCVLQHT